MPILYFPDDLRPPKTVTCAICGTAVPISKASAGLLDAEGNQAFACSNHFYRGREYIIGWVDFGARIRLKLLGRGIDPGNTEHWNW
jgi:hypothetical protein